MTNRLLLTLVLVGLFLICLSPEVLAKKKQGKKEKGAQAEDPYAEYVWPPPPDEPRIKLEEMITGRADVEGESKFKKALIGISPRGPYDRLVKPFAVAFDDRGRILVTDPGTGALLRFDREAGAMDIIGTKSSVSLKLPLGLDVPSNGLIYVADGALAKVLVFDHEGKLVSIFGGPGDMVNPTDVVLAPDGKRLFVADSKGHKVVIFDSESGKILSTFGERGEGEGQFSFPTSLAFSPDEELFVVDQLNSRVQIFTDEGEYLDQFGNLGVGFASFVRPKGIEIDDLGLIYVVDNAFNNVQVFDADLTLLTFVGEGGEGPGQFKGASGIATRDQEMAVIEQLGARLQVFRFISPKTGD